MSFIRSEKILSGIKMKSRLPLGRFGCNNHFVLLVSLLQILLNQSAVVAKEAKQ